MPRSTPVRADPLEYRTNLGRRPRVGVAAHRGRSAGAGFRGRSTLSYIAFKRRSYEEALESAESALVLHRRLDNLPGQAEALERIGDVHLALDERDLARTAWQQAVVILEHLQRATLPDVRRKLAALG